MIAILTWLVPITLANLVAWWMCSRASRKAVAAYLDARQAACRAAGYADTAKGHSETAMRAALGKVGVMMQYDEDGKPGGRETPFTHDGIEVEVVIPMGDPFAGQRGTDPVLPAGFRDDVVAADWPLTTLYIDERGQDDQR